MTFPYQQCQQPRQQHDRAQDFFPLVLNQGYPETIAKKSGHTNAECRKLKRKEEQKRNDGQNTKKRVSKTPHL